MAPLGYAMGGITLLALFALLHHPTGYGRAPADILASIRSQARIDQIVHGVLALIYSLLTASMWLFASRLGLRRFPAAFGLTAFSGALVLLVLAVMTDGFVIPAVASQCLPRSSPACVSDALILLRMSALQIEFLTRFALVGIALAVVSWSAALLSTRAIPRLAGLIGLASAGGQVIGLLLASPILTPHNLLPIMAAQAVWYLLAAALMILRCGPFEG
jgi:hypothetical protein